jgi:hypothetical protein
VDNTMRRFSTQQIAKGKRRLAQAFTGCKIRVNVYEVTPGLFDPKHGTRARAVSPDAVEACPLDIANRAEGLMQMALWL